MTDRPILFSGPMVLALLDGWKTMTRRLAKVSTVDGHKAAIYPPEELIELEEGEFARGTFHYLATGGGGLSGPYRLPHAVGDRLWVREGWALMPRTAYALPKTIGPDPDMAAYYRAGFDRSGRQPWKVSIHMPRWASRLTLTVTAVKVERLQDISAADSVAEGVACETCFAMRRSACDRRGCFASRAAFRSIWNRIHGKDAWDANPWVSASTFTVERRNIDVAASVAPAA